MTMQRPIPPLIFELMRTLPPTGAVFPAADRIKWLRAAWAIFGLIYGDVGEIDVSTAINVPFDEWKKFPANDESGLPTAATG